METLSIGIVLALLTAVLTAILEAALSWPGVIFLGMACLIATNIGLKLAIASLRPSWETYNKVFQNWVESHKQSGRLLDMSKDLSAMYSSLKLRHNIAVELLGLADTPRPKPGEEENASAILYMLRDLLVLSQNSTKWKYPTCPVCGKTLEIGKYRSYETLGEHGFDPNIEAYPERLTFECQNKDCKAFDTGYWSGALVGNGHYDGDWFSSKDVVHIPRLALSVYLSEEDRKINYDKRGIYKGIKGE